MMLEKIEQWESKGFRIAIYPQLFKDGWLWVSGVYFGNSNKAFWADCNNGLPRACYSTYEDAFKAIEDYINNFKNSKKK